VKIWDVDPKAKRPLFDTWSKELATLNGHDDRVHSVTFSPDGTLLATAGDDKAVRLWDAATAKEIAPPYRHRAGVWAVAFSHDGRRLAAGCWSPTGWVKTWPVGVNP
jgi:WD40 repeat protein